MTPFEPISMLPEEEEEEAATQNGTESLPVEREPTWEHTANEGALRALIFAKQDIKEKLINVPEWGVQVLVRGLTGHERATYVKTLQQSNMDLNKLYADLVILACYHPETRQRIFKPADRDALMGKSGAAIERIAMHAAEVSGLSEQALADMKKN